MADQSQQTDDGLAAIHDRIREQGEQRASGSEGAVVLDRTTGSLAPPA